MATVDLATLRDAAGRMFAADAGLPRTSRAMVFGIPLETVSRRPIVSMFISSQNDESDFGNTHTDHDVSFVIGSRAQTDSECLVIARELYRAFHEQTFTFGVTGAGLFWSLGIADQPQLVDGAFEMAVQYGLGVTWG